MCKWQSTKSSWKIPIWKLLYDALSQGNIEYTCVHSLKRYNLKGNFLASIYRCLKFNFSATLCIYMQSNNFPNILNVSYPRVYLMLLSFYISRIDCVIDSLSFSLYLIAANIWFKVSIDYMSTMQKMATCIADIWNYCYWLT